MSTAADSLSGERRVVTALFCDVVGSTSIAETMDPEDWSEVVGAAMTTMGDKVARFDGTVTEFAGDGIVALFGAPIAHEDDPYRAVRAGMEIVRAMRDEGQRGPGLDVRVGIHTGLVVVGDVAAGDLRTYSALGDTLNVASRLQAAAEPGTVVISAETRRLLGSDVEARLLGPTDLKGRAASVVLYQVTDVRQVEERRRGLPGLNSRMVGRQEELETLENLARLGRAGTGRVAAILGEPGVGKSRLLTELGRKCLESENETWAVGTCAPFDDEVPYNLVASLLRSLAGVGAGEPADVIEKAIDDLVEKAGKPGHAGTLKRLLGIGEADRESDADVLRAEYSVVLIDVVTGLARTRRLVVLACEDVHWADPSSVELISDVMRRIPTLPALLLLVMRPDRETAGWALLEEARRDLDESLTEVRLTPLGEESSREFISNLLEIESLPPTLRRLVLDKAEGNPFFLEEVVRMLMERELLENRDGRWIATGATEDLDVPETIEGLLASRIDLLDPDLRRAGRVAAVIGRRFAAHIFDMVYEDNVDGEPGSLHPHLAGLEAHGVVRLEEIEPELEFGFRHALFHDVMYRGLLRKERKGLHRAVAVALETAHPDRLDECSPALARHYAEAGDADRAIFYYLAAGRMAQSRGARVEAARSFTRAQELLEASSDPEPVDLIDAVVGRVSAGMSFIPGSEAIGLLENVLPIAEKLDDPDRLARLYERLIWAKSLQGQTYANSAQYRAQLDAGYALTPRLSDTGTAALLQAMMGGAYRSGDEYEASIDPLLKAVDGLESAGRLSDASYNAAMLADSLSQVGRFDEALEAIERARDLGEKSGDPNNVLDVDIIQGSIEAERGHLEEALEYTRRGIEGAEAHGNTFCNLAGNFKLADQRLRLGDVDTAISHLERSTGLAQFCNAGGYELLGQAWLTMARSRAGDHRPEEFDIPLAMAVDAGSRSAEGLIRLKRGMMLADMGNHEEAHPDFEKAIQLFADYGGLPNLARTHHEYGRSLEASGNGDEAVTHLQEAEEIFADLGIRPDPIDERN